MDKQVAISLEVPPSAAFPVDLATVVTEQWDYLVGGQYTPPPLPNLAALKTLFEVAYLAGMETDEARPLRFMLCCTSAGEDVKREDGASPVESWELSPSRAFNVQEMRRLAAVADFDSSAIWIQFTDGEPQQLSIRGLLNLGRSWAVARNAFAYHYDPLPHALIMRANAPGRIVVYQGGYRMAALSGGKLEAGRMRMSALDLLGAHPLFEEGQKSLRSVVKPPDHEPPREWHGFEWLAYVNCILAIVNGIQAAGHGGALILNGQSSNLAGSGFVRIKYRWERGSANLRDRFVEFMNARHRHGDMIWLADWNKDIAPSEQEIKLASFPLEELQLNVARSCAFVGGLAGTDGAIVLKTDLTVEGFGTEIVLDKVKPAKAYEVDNPLEREGWRELDTEQMGMRHRSAIRLCGAEPHLAVFVVSQDGGVSLIWNKDGDVCFQSGITTTNMNMVLA